MQHSDGQTILEVENLKTFINSKQIISDLSFSIEEGETVAIIGETGSGKSIAISSIFDLLDHSEVKVSSDKIVFINQLTIGSALPTEAAIVFQNAQLSLNPIIRCGKQIHRILKKHLKYDKVRAKTESEKLLLKVGLKEVERIYNSFPHQLSGGELQRVMIAMGLSCQPKLLILDEPTASLDMIIQAQIIDLLKALKKTENISILIITHDLELVSDFADRILHIDNGKIIANQDTSSFFTNPDHEISRNLVQQLKDFRSGTFEESSSEKLLIDAQNLSHRFNNGKYAFMNINLKIFEGEKLGIIGESGSGKTSLAKCISGIYKNADANLKLSIEPNKISYVFQDAYNSVDPDLSIKEVINEVIRLQDKKLNIEELLSSVNLSNEILGRKIHELSGGQRQRVNLARSLASNPSLLICDEITSGLDLKVQMDIIDLLSKKWENLTIVFISHDLSLVKYFCNRVLILKDGGMEFLGKTNELFMEKQSGYTKELINSIYKVKYFLNRE